MEIIRRKSSIKTSIFTEEFITKNHCNFELLKCPICSRVSIDPRVLDCCETVCCNTCLENYLKTKKQCMKCNKDITFSKPNKFILKIYDTIEYKCYFYKDGCDKTIPHQNVEKHLKYCEYNPKGLKICSKCNQEYFKHEEEKHNCLESLITVLENLKDNIAFYEHSKMDNVLKGIKFTYKFHRHGLFKAARKNGWSCDGCGDGHSTGEISYYCYECDYDMCQKCYNLKIATLEK